MSNAAVMGTTLKEFDASYCPTHLCHVPWAEEPNIYVHERRQLSLPFVGASSIADQIPRCRYLGMDDYRLRDIYIRRCYPGIPLRRMCPFHYFDYNRTLEASSIVCCCHDESFCNHKGDMRARTLYEPMRLCHYNNEYQQLFNKHAINDSLKHHSCLVHYANAEVMQVLTAGAKGNISRGPRTLNVLPGAPLLPIDYSYAFLNETNSCGYVEALVHSKYLSTRQCGNDPVLNTDFFPLKLYVCRCKTAINENGPSIPCDLQLEGEIAKKEAAEANTAIASVCASYSEVSNQITLEEKRTLINNRISGACQTSVRLVTNGHDYLISAGIATSLTVNAAKVPLNHITYSMYKWSGHRPSRCISWNGYSHCFCRSYERGVACNDGISEVKVAVRQAYKSLLVEV